MSSHKDKKTTYVKHLFYSVHFASRTGYKVLYGKDDIAYKQVSLRLYENYFPTLHLSDLMDQVFILYCV